VVGHENLEHSKEKEYKMESVHEDNEQEFENENESRIQIETILNKRNSMINKPPTKDQSTELSAGKKRPNTNSHKKRRVLTKQPVKMSVVTPDLIKTQE